MTSLLSTIHRATLFAHSRVKVLVLPVGKVSEAKFRSLAKEIRDGGQCVDLANLTLVPHKDTPFQNLSWQRSKMRFEFVHQEALSMEWDDFAAHRRIAAVICVCHCPSNPDLNVPYQDFLDIKKRFSVPGGPTRFKCYAFEPLENQADLPERADLIMFPNQESSRLRFYLTTCANDLASSLFEDLEQTIKAFKPTTYLRSPLPSDTVEASKQKKLRDGRREKHFGDICLLAGSPVDAFRHYKTACEMCKSQNDWAWYASALEGVATAMIAAEEEKEALAATAAASPSAAAAGGMGAGSASSAGAGAAAAVASAGGAREFCDKAVELYADVFSNYAKLSHTAVLSIEAAFKVARYFAKFGRKKETADMLMRMYSLRNECGGHDQISLTIEAGILCEKIGMHRKFGFYMAQAALLYRELHQHSSSHITLRLAAPKFRIARFAAEVAAAADDQADGKGEAAAEEAAVQALSAAVGGVLAAEAHASAQQQQQQQQRSTASSQLLQHVPLERKGSDSSLLAGVRVASPPLDLSERKDDSPASALSTVPLGTSDAVSSELVADSPAGSDAGSSLGVSAPALTISTSGSSSSAVAIAAVGPAALTIGVPMSPPASPRSSPPGSPSAAAGRSVLAAAAPPVESLSLFSSDDELKKTKPPPAVVETKAKRRAEPPQTPISDLTLIRRKERGHDVGRWVSLQRHILEHLIQSSRFLNDKRLTASATAYLLRALYPWLDKEYQKSLAADLWSITRMLPLNTCVDLTSIPTVQLMRPLDLTPSQLPHLIESADGGPASDDVFIFDPSAGDQKKKPRDLRYVAKEVFDVEVTLSNPFKFEIIVQRISLSTSGVAFEPFPASLNLPPETAAQTVLLSGKPLEAGLLCLRGVHIRAFNLMAEQLVDAVGRGLPGLQPPPEPDPEENLAELANLRSVRIVDPLPTVVVRCKFNGNMEGSLLIGESRVMDLFIENVGDLPVGSISLDIQETYLQNTQQSQEAYYDPAELSDSDDDGSSAAPSASAAASAVASVDSKSGGGAGSSAADRPRTLSARDHATPPADAAAAEIKSNSPSSDLVDVDLGGGAGGTAAAADGAAIAVAGAVGGAELETKAAAPAEPAVHAASAASSERKRKRLVEWDSSRVQKQLPLLPSQTLHVPLHVQAHRSCCGVSLTVKYQSNDKSTAYRTIKQIIGWDVTQGLEVRSVDLCPFSSSTPSSRPSRSKSRGRQSQSQSHVSIRVPSGPRTASPVPLPGGGTGSGRSSTPQPRVQNFGAAAGGGAAGASSGAAALVEPLSAGGPCSRHGMSSRDGSSLPGSRALSPVLASRPLDPGSPEHAEQAPTFHLDNLDLTSPSEGRGAGPGSRGAPLGSAVGAGGDDEFSRSLGFLGFQEQIEQVEAASASGGTLDHHGQQIAMHAGGADGARAGSLTASASASSLVSVKPRASDNEQSMLILEVENTADTTFRLYLCVDGVEKKSQGVFIEKFCNKRVILPLKRFSFGDDDEELRRLALRSARASAQLAASGAAGGLDVAEREKQAAALQRSVTQSRVFRRCRAAFARRVQLVWRSADDTHGVITNLQLTPDKLYRLVPDPVVFSFLMPGEAAAAAGAQGLDRSASTPTGPGTATALKINKSGPPKQSADAIREEDPVLQRPVSDPGGAAEPAGGGERKSDAADSGGVAAFSGMRSRPRPSTLSLLSPSAAGGSGAVSKLSAVRSSSAGSATNDSVGSGAAAPGQSSASASASGKHVYRVGEFKSIFITVTNRSCRALRLDLSVQPYQETINGGLDTNLQHKLMWLGSLTNALPELAPQQSHTHELAICFISAGRFNFQVFCRPTQALWLQFDDEKAASSAMTTAIAAVGVSATIGGAAAGAEAGAAGDSELVHLCHKPLVCEAVSDASY